MQRHSGPARSAASGPAVGRELTSIWLLELRRGRQSVGGGGRRQQIGRRAPACSSGADRCWSPHASPDRGGSGCSGRRRRRGPSTVVKCRHAPACAWCRNADSWVSVFFQSRTTTISWPSASLNPATSTALPNACSESCVPREIVDRAAAVGAEHLELHDLLARTSASAIGCTTSFSQASIAGIIAQSIVIGLSSGIAPSSSAETLNG